ncbi:MAG: hypothetical protein KF718_19015 [Polyangiaceae bacterium]|nr:hypothetical protein [Polyangiaceae bacterium]
MRGPRAALALAGSLAAATLVGAAPLTLSPEDAPQSVLIFVDSDDDDDDGRPDREQTPSSKPILAALLEIGLPRAAPAVADGSALRLLRGEAPLAGAAKVKRLWLQGLTVGSARVLVSGKPALEVSVVEAFALDSRGRLMDLARSHVAITRSLPASLTRADAVDDEAVSFLVASEGEVALERLELASLDPGGRELDRLGPLRLTAIACPPSVPAGRRCQATGPVRATSDLIDRSHPGSSWRSLRAEVGGRLALTHAGQRAVSLRVGGPRQSALGPIERVRGRLRVRLVRQSPGASPPIGGTEARALALARDEVHVASGLWGQCGIHFGPAAELDVAVVDPPPPFLIAIGGAAGLPATGGAIALAVDGRPVTLATAAGETPERVARRLAAAIRKLGFVARVSPNPRVTQGALPTADVLVARPQGGWSTLSSDGPPSTDTALAVQIGSVDLSDGLTHFSDFDAAAGTLEERTLIKALDDGDPRTIEVLVIPSFSRSGRIGESFIFGDGGSIQNVVIVDRAGLVAGARSYVLAHELGHILLDMPGHPDDYGVDSPSSLMDADAADPTIFGPRRLSLAECERALRQSGPGAPVALLASWPLYAR